MKENTKKELFSWAKTIGFTLVLIAIIRGVLFTPSLVQGESMMPTLENNERVLVNKIGYSISGLERFDIIVFHGKEGYDLVKRVMVYQRTVVQKMKLSEKDKLFSWPS